MTDSLRLAIAIRERDVIEVARCLKHGVSPNDIYGPHGHRPIHACISDGREPRNAELSAIIDLLLKYGCDLDAITHPDGPSTLRMALSSRCLDVARILLEHGAVFTELHHYVFRRDIIELVSCPKLSRLNIVARTRRFPSEMHA